MSRVLITPIKSQYCNAEPFELQGRLTSKYFDNDGLIYYIAGQSFPESIVTILEDAGRETA